MPSMLKAGVLFALASSGFAQQYLGNTIPNSLGTVSGATISYFRIHDANGGDTTLINYFLHPSGVRQNTTLVKRAVVMIHGSGRDANTYFTSTFNALKKAITLGTIPEVSQDSVAIITPKFTNDQDTGTGYPYTNGVSTTNVLAWHGTDWSEGATNIYPTTQKSVSSFDVIDQILQYFDDATIYPNLKEIVVGGHSMGAQFVHRYAAVGKELNLRAKIVYWLGNPSSFVWLNDLRPVSTANCSIYNNWNQGLSAYTIEYENSFVNGNLASAVQTRYASRDIAYDRGLNDFGDASDDCAPFTTGNNRGERMYNFIGAFPPDSGDTVDYNAGIGHNAANMMAADPGLYRLFFDNFNGDGSRHADFGARQVPGDNPHPVST